MTPRRSILLLVAVIFAVLILPGLAAAAPATLTLTSTPPVVVCGQATQLAGTALDAQGRPLLGATLALSAQRYDEAGFTPAGDAVVTDLATGAFSVKISPRYNATYRVEYAGDGTGETGTEHGFVDLLVRVRPRIRTEFPSKDLWAGQTLTLKGSVAPAHPDPGSTASAQVTIEQKIDGVWQTFRTLPLSGTSTFSTTWKPTNSGFKYFRVTMAADNGHAVMITTSRRIVVNNPNPHHIPITHAHYIVIDHSEFRLYYYEHGRVIKKWNCVLGKPSTPTPYGHFKIYSRVPSPGYGMGPYFLGYYGAIGIHGTSQPWLIRRFPRAFSHGCARLYNLQITWLYPRVPVGTPVWNIR
jgi:lipoprotein-anchoring transpeptidase ErfK/SrfK